MLTAPQKPPPKILPLFQSQLDYRRSSATFRGFVGGIGSGKSYIGARDLILRAKPGGLYMVGAPTYPMLRDSTLRSFLDAARDLKRLGPKGFNKSDMICKLGLRADGPEVLFRSTEHHERLRGPNLRGVWLDEASLTQPGLFEILIGRLRQGGEQGWLAATFTPKGKTHWTYKVFGRNKPDTEIFRARTADNTALAPTFAKTLSGIYTGTYAQQELDGLFVDEDDSFAVLPATWVRAAIERWQEGPPAATRLSSVGVDVAYGGADRTAIARRYGMWFARLLKYEGSQTPSGAASAYFVRQSMGEGLGALINVDGIGYGAACCEALTQIVPRLQVMPVNFGAGCDCRDRTGLFSFLNIRAFAYWSLREALDPTSGLNIALPPDEELEEELTAARWTAVGGVVRIERKEDIKKRLGRSPDCADAVALAVLLPGFGGEPLAPIRLSA